MNWETDRRVEEVPLEPWDPGTAATFPPLQLVGEGLVVRCSYPFPLFQGAVCVENPNPCASREPLLALSPGSHNCFGGRKASCSFPPLCFCTY